MDIFNSRSLSAQYSLPPLLGLLDVDIAADPPVAEPEGVGHGVSNVGPADDGDRDANDGVEDCHDLADRSLGSNVAIAFVLTVMRVPGERNELPIVVMTVMQ